MCEGDIVARDRGLKRRFGRLLIVFQSEDHLERTILVLYDFGFYVFVLFRPVLRENYVTEERAENSFDYATGNLCFHMSAIAVGR